jgi:hypothetical protein
MVNWALDKTAGFLVANIIGMFKNFFLMLLNNAVVPLLTNVMSYQNFFSEGVNAGWEITRNFSNLFFALVLLLIAISTVLNVGSLDNYTAKRMLPNFIFVALFINFSKAIVGFLIDISQIIMISFYNSFGPNMANIIGTASRIAESGSESNTENIILNIFTIVVIAILVFVLLWTALILAMRIVTLWFVIMLAPLAFMATLIPGLKSISDDWKKQLQEALVTGPTLMFFLYLAFSLMSTGISANTATTGGDNLMNNGNLINYVLVIGLLFLANSTATKAAQSAPTILKNAVGVAGTVATLGLGAYVGAGGVGTGKMIKNTREYGDKTLGGLTNITRQNAKYEAAKKDFKDRQANATGIFGENKRKILGREVNFNPLTLTQGLSSEGKKNLQDGYEAKYANELYVSGKLEEKANERYKKIFNSNQATGSSDLKGIENIEKLISDLDTALKDGDKAMAMALSSRISELKSWDKVFVKNSKFDSFKDYSNNYEFEGDQLGNFINDKFGTDSSGNKMKNNKILNEFKSRQVNILRSKGDDNFTVGLTDDTPKDQDSLAKKAIDAGIQGSGAMFVKNNKMFNVREKEKDSEGNDVYKFKNDGVASYKLDTSKFITIIKKENSIDLLKDPKSWTPFGNKRDDIKEAIEEELKSTGIDPQDREKLEASLEGLISKKSGSSKVPSS